MAVVRAVRDAGVVGRTSIQSFDHRSLRAVRALDAEIELTALTRRGDRVDHRELASFGAAVWSPDHRALDREAVAAAQTAGLRVVPWTVNDPSTMHDLIEMGVDGIITDRPDLHPNRPPDRPSDP